LVELTPELDTAWLYKSPITVNGIAGRDFTPADANFPSDPSFRAIKYLPQHPALKNRELIPGARLEGGDGECDIVMGLAEALVPSLSFYPNPVHDQLVVESADSALALEVTVIDHYGRRVAYSRDCGTVRLDTSTLPDGLYIIKANNLVKKILKRSGSY
jgi:hypothetical protein